jgi:cyclophilin family peptidyl-prolyl cis-trans isomerase
MTSQRPHTVFIWLIALLSISFPGCGGESPAKDANPSSEASTAPAEDSSTATPQLDRYHPVVRIQTSEGTITVQLDAVQAPGTVRNFLNYANDGFYDNTLIHYVDPDNMLVAGGYTNDRQPKPPRLPIRNEAHNGLKNLRGTIATTREPALIDSATSQFFINLKDAPQRDHQGDGAEQYGYCVFGQVIEGLDVADRIARSATTSLGGDLAQTPDPIVTIQSVRVVR